MQGCAIVLAYLGETPAIALFFRCEALWEKRCR
jgi:hypothetical protein